MPPAVLDRDVCVTNCLIAISLVSHRGPCFMRLICTSLLVLGFLATTSRSDHQGDDKETKPKPKFTIGKETTYVTGPVDADGYIDYAAALNERLGKGIKPEDNANVLLWKAFGPHPRWKMPPDYFKLLGIEAPPERGEYLIGLERYIRERLKIDRREGVFEILQQLDQATKRPWTPREYADIAGWLKANDKPMALVVEASKRPRYFSPVVPTKTKKGSSGPIGARLPSVAACREAGSALTARAMLHIAEGRPENAWQDLLACHRLARLIARGGHLGESLVSIAIDSRTSWADLAFLEGAKLTEKQIRDCLCDLQKLPPLPEIAALVDLGDRFEFLDIIMMVNRDGIHALENLGWVPSRLIDPRAGPLLDEIKWDPALRNANRWYDRMVTALRVKDRNARDKNVRQLEQQLKTLRESLTEEGGLANVLLAKATAKARDEAIGDLLISLLVPPYSRLQQSADQTEQTQSNLHLAFALASYQREHGDYPRKLETLAPKYLATIPHDLFSGKALIYRPVEHGYLLYSVGANGKDEQGRTNEDDPLCDDIAVRMPLPKPSRK
jgi:hypothetical protein